MTDYLKATETVGGHKILRISKLGKGYSVTVEDNSWAAGQISYQTNSLGKVRPNADQKYNLKKPA